MKCKRQSCSNEARANTYRGHVPMYCSRSCNVKDKVNELRKRRKREIVDMFGGGCSKCGYDKCLAALQFHHTDPSQKDIALSRAVTLRMDRIKDELMKCVLLCANCHAEEHWMSEEEHALVAEIVLART